jgi:hypothetical protein
VSRQRLLLAVIALAALACNTLAGAVSTTMPTPVVVVPSDTPPPAATQPPDDTAAPPATETAPAPTPEPPTATAEPATPVPVEAWRIAVQAPDGNIGVYDLDGQPRPIDEAAETLYVRLRLTTDFDDPVRLYAIGPEGVVAVEGVDDIQENIVAYTGPENPGLAWAAYQVDGDGSITSQIIVSDLAGGNRRTVLEETSEMTHLGVWRFASGGQRLLFSHEPLGLGGYILFGGISDLWALNLADGAADAIVLDMQAGAICLDDLSPNERRAAHHCNLDAPAVIDRDSNAVTTIEPPSEVDEFRLHGDVRFSPAADRVAFALARGEPEDEQGWVAVSDGLEGPSRLVATAPTGEFFQVVQWLDDNTLLLQSWGEVPGVWFAFADGGDPTRFADGTVLGVMDGL